MKIKNILTQTIIAILLISSSSAFAQSCPPKHQKKKEMAEKLDLTEEQKAEIKVIHDEHRLEAQEIKADASLTDDEKKAKIKELRVEHKSKFTNVLTVDQREALEVMKAEHKSEIKKEKSPDERAEAKTNRLAEILSLTESQKEEVLNLNTKTINSIMDLRKNETIEAEEKKRQMKELKSAHKLEMEKILNDEQFVKYEEHLAAKKKLRGHHKPATSIDEE